MGTSTGHTPRHPACQPGVPPHLLQHKRLLQDGGGVAGVVGDPAHQPGGIHLLPVVHLLHGGWRGRGGSGDRPVPGRGAVFGWPSREDYQSTTRGRATHVPAALAALAACAPPHPSVNGGKVNGGRGVVGDEVLALLRSPLGPAIRGQGQGKRVRGRCFHSQGNGVQAGPPVWPRSNTAAQTGAAARGAGPARPPGTPHQGWPGLAGLPQQA